MDLQAKSIHWHREFEEWVEECQSRVVQITLSPWQEEGEDAREERKEKDTNAFIKEGIKAKGTK